MNFERDVPTIAGPHFVELEATLRARYPGLEATYGLVSGGSVKVFCYLKTSWPGLSGEPLVTGVHILEEASGSLRLFADMCREDGHVHLSEPSVLLHQMSPTPVLESHISAIAGRLCRRAVDAPPFKEK